MSRLDCNHQGARVRIDLPAEKNGRWPASVRVDDESTRDTFDTPSEARTWAEAELGRLLNAKNRRRAADA